MFHLVLDGSRHENGIKHGETFRKEIHTLSQIRRELLSMHLSDLSPLQIDELALAMLQKLKNYPDLMEEFQGICRGAKISAVDLMVLNNYTDMKDFGSKSTFNDWGGCSVFAYRKNGTFIAGQTWDMHASAEAHMLALTVKGKNSNAPDAKILTLTGCIALAGVNEHGVSLFINNLNTDETNLSLFWPGLARKILEQKSRREASDYLFKNIPSSAHNYLVCDPTGAMDIETTGKVADISFEQTDGFAYFHTNHFLGKLVAKEAVSRRSPTTLKRWQALKDYFDTLKEPSVERFCEDLFNSNDKRFVCIPSPKNDPNGAKTCGGLIYDYGSKQGILFAGEFNDRKIHVFSWN